MLKLIQMDSSYYNDEPLIKRIDVSSLDGLVKSAADSKIVEYIKQILPEPEIVYLHILAMGASDYWGQNKNGDRFESDNLRKYYKTFETTPAHVYRNHINKNPDIAMGKVVFATYNDKMQRVELIVKVDANKARDLLEKLDAGEPIATSMAVKTPSDRCSLCNNRARTRQSYCRCLSENLGKLLPTGQQISAINDDELKFFDISWIMSGRQADPTSYVLQKVASTEGEKLISSAELAELEGLTEKEASLKKLSEFIKEISDGVVVDADPSLDVILDKVKDPTHDAIDILRNYDLKQTLCSLAHLGISPSLGWLAELIARKTLGKGGEGIGGLVEGYIKEVGVDGLPIAQGDFGDPVGPNIAIVSALTPSIKQASLMPEYVEGRILEGGNAYIPGTNVGYIGNGPRIEETPYEKFRRENLAQHPEGNVGLAPLVKTLMIIGGAALAAKWYITQLIEQKMRENEASMLRTDAKIRLVEKRAEDYRSTHRLAKSDMIRVLKQRIN